MGAASPEAAPPPPQAGVRAAPDPQASALTFRRAVHFAEDARTAVLQTPSPSTVLLSGGLGLAWSPSGAWLGPT